MSKNNLIFVKSSKNDNYLCINSIDRTLEFTDEQPSSLFSFSILSKGKILLKSQDGYYARHCEDNTFKVDTVNKNHACIFDISFLDKKEMYIKSNSSYLYIDSNSTLKSDVSSRGSESLFKIYQNPNKSREPFVTVYSDAFYKGNLQPLVPGYYDIYQLNIGNDTLSSIKVPPGFVVTLFEDADFKGNSITITSDTPYIGDYFNDKVSSLIVENLANNSVAIYSDADYKGNVQYLSPGYYDINQLNIGNDTLSSIKVPQGFVVTLFEDANFKGNSLTITNNIPYIGNNFNDKVSSIIVNNYGKK